MPTDFITGITEDVVKVLFIPIWKMIWLKDTKCPSDRQADMPTEQEKKWLDIGDQSCLSWKWNR